MNDDEFKEKLRTITGHCGWCGEYVSQNQSVSLAQPLHSECALRGVIGSADHILRGPHRPGTCKPDDPALTKREAALAAVAAWYMMNPPKKEQQLSHE